MRLSIITTSVGGWEEYVKPLIDSIRKYEPSVHIVVVDAGDNFPISYKKADIIKTPVLNCAESQNVGIRHSISYMNPDWFLILDCDTICEGKFRNRLVNLPATAIHGNQMHPKNRGGGRKDPWKTPYEWLDGWIYAIPKRIYEDIGGFDENFKGSGFEDADYCWRALDAGYSLNLVMFPFNHLTAGQKKNISDGYNEVRRNNIKYLRKKWKL